MSSTQLEFNDLTRDESQLLRPAPNWPGCMKDFSPQNSNREKPPGQTPRKLNSTLSTRRTKLACLLLVMSHLNPAAAVCVSGTKSCVDGFYLPTPASSCTACPAGKSCVIAADCSATTANCANGEYSLDAETACNPCPTGKFQIQI